MYCEECDEHIEVTEEYTDTATDMMGVERDYRIYLLVCGHDVSYPTTSIRHPS